MKEVVPGRTPGAFQAPASTSEHAREEEVPAVVAHQRQRQEHPPAVLHAGAQALQVPDFRGRSRQRHGGAGTGS